jgi:hypothetical protein
MVNVRLDPQKHSLPEAKDPLHVIKPIGKYEPRVIKSNKTKVEEKPFEVDPDKFHKKKFPSEPKSHGEIRNMTM